MTLADRLLIAVTVALIVVLAVIAARIQPKHPTKAPTVTRSAEAQTSRDLTRPSWPPSNGLIQPKTATLAVSQTVAPFRPAATPYRSAAATIHTSPSAGAKLARSVATQGPDVSGSGASGPNVKARIEWCESRNDPRALNPTSGASGAWQFLDSTWQAVTGLPGAARDYPLAVQSRAFDALYARRGTKPWASSRECWS